MDKDNLWNRRSNTSKLSLATGVQSTNGGGPISSDHITRPFAARRHGETSSHSNKNPFSPSTTALASPTTGASSAFGLGSGAFASFGAGAAKTPKTPGGALDFGSVVGSSGKTPVLEKQVKDLGSKPSKASLTESSKTSNGPRHPLRDSWTVWYRPPISKSSGFVEYEKTLHQIVSFDTVEDFFDAFRHLNRPSTLPLVSDYHIFKKGIRPVWEDDENKKGGKWIVRLKKGLADRYWEELCLAVVGDQFFEASEEVCGAVFSVRNGEDILSIWTSRDGARALRIRETLKKILDFPTNTKVEWKSHDSSIQQRTAIDDARKDKANHHHSSPTSARNGNKEGDYSLSDKKHNP